MSRRTLFAFRFRRRLPALLLILGLILVLAPTVTATPASAGFGTASASFCTTTGFLELNPANPSLSTTWTLTGSRSNAPFTHRYWMAQQPSTTSSTPYYRRSVVAQCNSVNLLVSSTTLTTTGAAGTVYCTSSTDVTPPASEVTYRYVGQRWAPTLGIPPTATIRYWHVERFSYISFTWTYDSSYVVRC